TPADPAAASANPGQAITLVGSGFDFSTDVVFPTVNSSGTRSERVVRPVAVSADGTRATVVVPSDVAVTGDVGVVGDRLDARVRLQVVPVLTGVDFTSVASDGSTAQVQLRGEGFVEDAGSAYRFGATTVVDTSASSGPDVFGGFVHDNDAVNLTLTLTGDWAGAVTVTTAGGTRAPFTAGLSGISSAAPSGTPADAAQASANPGQAVTLTRTALATATASVA